MSFDYGYFAVALTDPLPVLILNGRVRPVGEFRTNFDTTKRVIRFVLRSEERSRVY